MPFLRLPHAQVPPESAALASARSASAILANQRTARDLALGLREFHFLLYPEDAKKSEPPPTSPPPSEGTTSDTTAAALAPGSGAGADSAATSGAAAAAAPSSPGAGAASTASGAAGAEAGAAAGAGAADEGPRAPHFWETDPTSLVGRRVEILWSKGARYNGVVAEFDEHNGKHHVVYDDGDQKWCVEFLV